VVKGESRNVGGVQRCGVQWCAALDGEQRYHIRDQIEISPEGSCFGFLHLYLLRAQSYRLFRDNYSKPEPSELSAMVKLALEDYLRNHAQVYITSVHREFGVHWLIYQINTWIIKEIGSSRWRLEESQRIADCVTQHILAMRQRARGIHNPSAYLHIDYPPQLECKPRAPCIVT
jgi:hypothetical protein